MEKQIKALGNHSVHLPSVPLHVVSGWQQVRINSWQLECFPGGSAPTPVFMPGESHAQRSLVGYSPWGHKELDMTEQLSTHRLRWKKAPMGRQSSGWGVSEAGKGQQPQELMMGLGGWLNNFLYFPGTLFWEFILDPFKSDSPLGAPQGNESLYFIIKAKIQNCGKC